VPGGNELKNVKSNLLEKTSTTPELFKIVSSVM